MGKLSALRGNKSCGTWQKFLLDHSVVVPFHYYNEHIVTHSTCKSTLESTLKESTLGFLAVIGQMLTRDFTLSLELKSENLPCIAKARDRTSNHKRIANTSHYGIRYGMGGAGSL